MKFINLNYLVIIIYLISSSFSYSIDRPDIKNLIIHKSKKKIENRAKKVGENFTNENLSHKYYEHLFKHIEKNKIKR